MPQETPQETPQTTKIGIIGDYDATSPFHRATEDALQHAAHAQAVSLDVTWLPTAALAEEAGQAMLDPCDGLWCAPGSPYASMQGALRAIRFARETPRPYIGT